MLKQLRASVSRQPAGQDGPVLVGTLCPVRLRPSSTRPGAGNHMFLGLGVDFA